jgi:hypothetical protein
MTDYIKTVYDDSGRDIFTSWFVGGTAAVLLNGSILIPAAIALLTPIVKDLFSRFLIPLFRKRFKITKKDDLPDNPNDNENK